MVAQEEKGEITKTTVSFSPGGDIISGSLVLNGAKGCWQSHILCLNKG